MIFDQHNDGCCQPAAESQSLKLFFTMERFVGLYLVIIFFSNSVEGRINSVENRDLVVPKFISAVILECSKKDPTRNHDVALIQLELGAKSGVIDDIAEVVMRNVSESSVFIHRSLKSIERHRIHTASFVVIVSDVSNAVRNSLLLF